MPPRLNPFALPSETTLRFVLLIVAVLGSSLFISNWQFFTFTDGDRELARYAVCLDAERTATQASGDPLFGGQVLQRCLAPSDHRKGRLVLAGPAGVLGLGAVLYLVWPAVMRRRRRLRPLAPDVPQVAEAVAELSLQAGLRRAPEALWNPLRPGGGALAFGPPWRPAVAMGAGLVASALRDRPAFDAVMRHELAHLRNGDVAKTYLSIALWWAFVVGGIVPLLITLPGNDGIAKILARLAALTLIVYLTRNAILRSRETYADLRASTWDGPGGALRRVLEAMPRPRASDPVRRLIRLHPDPGERRRAVDAPAGMFRLDADSAFLAGAAGGIAFPNLVNVLRLLTSGTAAHSHVTTYAALLVAPWVAGVLAVTAWRSTQAALAGPASPARVVVPALALAAGLAVGQLLSLDAIADTGGGVADIGAAAFTALWTALLVAFVLLFMRWLVLGAEAWLPVARESPRRVLLGAVAFASLVFAWGLGQFSVLSFFIETLARDEQWRAIAPDAATLGRTVVDLVTMKDVTFLLLAALWAFPLAAWAVRRGPRAIGAWAYLDGGAARAISSEAPAVRPALAAAAVAGLAFLVFVIGWRLALRASIPLSERLTDAWILDFAYRAEWIAVAVQTGVAVLVALRARSAGALLGLLAAFASGVLIVAAWLGAVRAAGCLDAIALRPGGSCPSPMETSFMWTTLKDWVDEGALAALVAIPAALGARRLVRRARTQLALRQAPT